MYDPYSVARVIILPLFPLLSPINLFVTSICPAVTWFNDATLLPAHPHRTSFLLLVPLLVSDTCYCGAERVLLLQLPVLFHQWSIATCLALSHLRSVHEVVSNRSFFSLLFGRLASYSPQQSNRYAGHSASRKLHLILGICSCSGFTSLFLSNMFLIIHYSLLLITNHTYQYSYLLFSHCPSPPFPSVLWVEHERQQRVPR